MHPRVFEIHDFFSPIEADELIGKSEQETSATHKLHRSTTGSTDGQISSRRTSENAWDTHGKLALKIKRRCLSMLGMDEYWESHTDGLQILRYKNMQAYTTHPDYLDLNTAENYNYNSSNVGGNRFATVLLYMSDLEEDAGGETVFEHGWPADLPEDKRLSKPEALRELRASPSGALLKKGSWEEDMTALCRSRLAMKPGRGRAALFYSQLPNGTGQLNAARERLYVETTTSGISHKYSSFFCTFARGQVGSSWRMSGSARNKVGCQPVGVERTSSRV